VENLRWQRLLEEKEFGRRGRGDKSPTSLQEGVRARRWRKIDGLAGGHRMQTESERRNRLESPSKGEIITIGGGRTRKRKE